MVSNARCMLLSENNQQQRGGMRAFVITFLYISVQNSVIFYR